MTAISFGGGVNSVAMTILLVNEGWRGDIVFADTGCEWPETYEYMDAFEREWLNPHGLKIRRLDRMAGPGWDKMAEGLSLIEYCESRHVLPVPHRRWCTINWKVQPLAPYDEMYLGIAADESHRSVGKLRPLCDRHITRRECKRIIRAEGLAVPQKSGCYICPFQRKTQWRRLWEQHPDLFERAAQLEEMVSEKRNKVSTLDPSGLRTLRDLQAQFELQARLW